MERKMIVALVGVVLLLGVCVLAGCSNEGKNYSVKPTEFTEKWLNYINDTVRLTKLAIPGSHDSGTVGMPDLYCTQNVSIGEQLDLGVRYFDIRVHKNEDKLTIFHGGYKKGADFYGILDNINDFMTENPSEFLVLDFQHFSGDSQDAVRQALMDKGIINRAVKNTSGKSDLDYIDSLTVGDVRGKVIITWGSSEDKDYLFRRNNDACTIQDACLDSMYETKLNMKSSKDYIKTAMPKYFNHILEKGKGLTVLQAQLTGGVIYQREKGHNQNMTDYVHSIANNSEYLSNVNIIMRDFVGMDKEKIYSILSLNLNKNAVKTDMREQYQASLVIDEE